MENQKSIIIIFLDICASVVILVYAEDLTTVQIVCGQPHEVVVETDPVNQRYIPYMIRVPRCIGSYKTYKPTERRCVPSNTRKVYYRAINSNTSLRETIPILYHTSCRGDCLPPNRPCNKFQIWDTTKCQCKCKHAARPYPNPCSSPKEWLENKCDCGCLPLPTKCPLSKEWDDNTCACTCKKVHLDQCATKRQLVNQTDCECTIPTVPICKCLVKTKWMLGAMAGGVFVVLIIMFFCVYHCCLKTTPKRRSRRREY